MKPFIPKIQSTCSDGSVFFIYGCPFVGKSHILSSIKSACDSVGQNASFFNKVSPMKDSELKSVLLDKVYKSRHSGSRAIFIEGFPRNLDHVKLLYDSGLFGGSSGYIVRVSASDSVLLNRAFKSGVSKSDMLPEISRYSKGWVEIYNWAKDLNLHSNLYQIDNSHDSGYSCAILARYAGLDRKLKRG